MISKEVYDRMFATEKYSQHDPEEEPRYQWAYRFVEGHDVIDVGTGRGAYVPNFLKRARSVSSFDLNQYNTHEFKTFTSGDLCSPEGLDSLKTLSGSIVTCLDCLEHVPAQFVEHILETFIHVAPLVCLAVSNHVEVIDGHTLHLTRQNFDWWQSLISKYYVVTDSHRYDNLRYFFYGAKKT